MKFSACLTTWAVNSGSLENLREISIVSTLKITAIARPTQNRIVCVLRLYHPVARSIESSNHFSRADLNFAMSPCESAQRLLMSSSVSPAMILLAFDVEIPSVSELLRSEEHTSELQSQSNL